MIASALAAATLLAATPKVAVLPLGEGEGVNPQLAESVGEALVAELRKLEAADLLSSKQMSDVLSVERQKQLLGCSDNACIAEIAGALDVDQIVTGTLSRLGNSWLLQLQRLDARNARALAHASAREQGGMDKLLDKLPQLAREVFAGLTPGSAPRAQVAAVTPPKPAALPTAPAEQALAPPYADVPFEGQVDRAKLQLLTDGKGRYVAVSPFEISGPHFAGTKDALYLQRVAGGGSQGTQAFSFVFWEPRGKRQQRGHFEHRDGKYWLDCDRKQVPLTPVKPAEAKKLLAKAKLYDVRWQRQAHLLARDDDGNWYLADQARLPEGNDDFRLYLGEPGDLRGYTAKALARDEAGELFRAADGKLKVDRRKNAAEWVLGEAKRPLTLLDLYQNVSQIYGSSGPYAGMPMGTACDGHLP